MAGKLNIPKFVDFRNKVMRHKTLKFPVLSLTGKTTIAIHHSLTKQGLGGSNAEGYARYHVQTNGWPSIGYHYVIEPDGTIKWCNDIETRAYHVGDHNNYAVGICLTGDFRTEKPTAAQEESLRNLVNGLKKSYTHLKYVKGHNEFSGYGWKECPVFDYKKVLADTGVATEPSTPKPPNDTYKVVTKIDGYTTAANAKSRKNKRSKVSSGTYHVYKKSDGMINITSKKGVPGSWINPADNKAASKPAAKSFLIRTKPSSLWYYNKPSWDAKVGTVKKGTVLTVVDTLTVNGSKMYKLKSGTYITANPQYVEKV